MAGTNRQRGGFMLPLIVVIILACVGIVAAEAFPTYLEYTAALKAINKAKESGGSVAELRAAFERARAIDNIESIKGKDLEITKQGDQVVISFAYNREIHLFGPAFLLLKYEGTTNKPPGGR